MVVETSSTVAQASESLVPVIADDEVFVAEMKSKVGASKLQQRLVDLHAKNDPLSP